MSELLVGVDVGGTFTDCVLVDSDAGSTIVKTFTNPQDPSEGVLRGLEKLAAQKGRSLNELLRKVVRIVHGTTITTNAVLTGSGARTGFLTTKGFRDVLLMRRGIRENQFDSKRNPPPPLVPRGLTFTVTERVDRKGNEIVPLDAEEARRAILSLKKAGVEAVVVSFLFSFLNPSHEQQVAAILREEFPEAYASLSIEVLPQLGAYLRHSTTALNGYVGPVLMRYLNRLTSRLHEADFQGRLLVMQSSGGVMAPQVASRFACRTLLSGPAGGPVAALFYGQRDGKNNLITMDMGGTSFDVALIRNGEVATTTEGEVGGHAMAFPVLDIRTVGAGGGSVAWVDEGRVLHVGPKSAGADPGPICYGRGGIEPTVTDADLVLGLLAEDSFLGGEFPLSLDRAHDGIREKIGVPLQVNPIAAAEGIYRLVNSTMADAIRLISIGRGHDPRDFTLVVAGGAGPVHAAAIAREIGIRELLIPRETSVFCAAGMLLSDLRHDYVRTFPGLLSALSGQGIQELYQEMEAEALATLKEEGIPRQEIDLYYTSDLKYAGQFHEISVPFDGPARGLKKLKESFDDLHHKLYGYSLRDQAVEALHWRLTAIGRTERPSSRPRAARRRGPVPPRHREVIFDGARAKTIVYRGDEMSAGMKIQGPAIIEETTTTVVIPPGWELAVNEFGDYQMTVRP